MSARNALASSKSRFEADNSPQFELVLLKTLRPNPKNARTHSRKQIGQIAKSLKRFGVINPLVADDSGLIIAGHARAEAAKLIGLTRVPVIRLSHLNEAEVRAYMLAD